MKRSNRLVQPSNRKRAVVHLFHVILCFFAAWFLIACAFWRKSVAASSVLRVVNNDPQKTTLHPDETTRLDTRNAPVVVTGTTSTSSRLLSTPHHTQVSTDVRGNLGPASVLLNNGTNWLKDRWQAASDMHGTAIAGTHWVQLDFTDSIVALTRIVLDWETAYSDDYKIVGVLQQGDKNENALVVLYDTAMGGEHGRSVHEYGQSPGVAQKLPLHVIHDLQVEGAVLKAEQKKGTSPGMKSVRIEIRKPFHAGWGVSLWRVEVYGY
jgi:hypothetical protein